MASRFERRCRGATFVRGELEPGELLIGERQQPAVVGRRFGGDDLGEQCACLGAIAEPGAGEPEPQASLQALRMAAEQPVEETGGPARIAAPPGVDGEGEKGSLVALVVGQGPQEGAAGEGRHGDAELIPREVDQEARGDLLGGGEAALPHIELGEPEDELPIVGGDDVGPAAEGLVVEPLVEQEEGDDPLWIALRHLAHHPCLDVHQLLGRQRLRVGDQLGNLEGRDGGPGAGFVTARQEAEGLLVGGPQGAGRHPAVLGTAPLPRRFRLGLPAGTAAGGCSGRGSRNAERGPGPAGLPRRDDDGEGGRADRFRRSGGDEAELVLAGLDPAEGDGGREELQVRRPGAGPFGHPHRQLARPLAPSLLELQGEPGLRPKPVGERLERDFALWGENRPRRRQCQSADSPRSRAGPRPSSGSPGHEPGLAGLGEERRQQPGGPGVALVEGGDGERDPLQPHGVGRWVPDQDPERGLAGREEELAVELEPAPFQPGEPARADLDRIEERRLDPAARAQGVEADLDPEGVLLVASEERGAVDLDHHRYPRRPAVGARDGEGEDGQGEPAFLAAQEEGSGLGPQSAGGEDP